jgi:hypothetical protein
MVKVLYNYPSSMHFFKKFLIKIKDKYLAEIKLKIAYGELLI